MTKTVFGDLRHDARAVYRVKTQGSTYLVGIHEDEGRKYVIVRGIPGYDRENVVLRDTDPRVGDWSLFDIPHSAWPGRQLQIASMTSSEIVEATLEDDPAVIAMVSGESVAPPSPWSSPLPAGMSSTPAIVQVGGRGTHPGQGEHVVANKPLAVGGSVARDVVVGGQVAAAAAHRPELPYPQRHVRHAEDAAALLRSVARRDRIFEDVAFNKDRELLTRLRKALAECDRLIEQIQRRDNNK